MYGTTTTSGTSAVYLKFRDPRGTMGGGWVIDEFSPKKRCTESNKQPWERCNAKGRRAALLGSSAIARKGGSLGVARGSLPAG